MTYDCLLEREAWLAGGGHTMGGGGEGGGRGACDAATRHHIYIYIYATPPSGTQVFVFTLTGLLSD